jgi:cell division protein FtsW
MAVAVGLVPTTGVTLPFFSAGGSSLFVTLAMCGVLVNLSRRVPNV